MDSEGTFLSPMNEADSWKTMKNKLDDQTALVIAKEQEMRGNLNQGESPRVAQTCKCASTREVPKVFLNTMESPERDIDSQSVCPPQCPTGFFHKVMENAMSMLAMKCSAIHPSTTTTTATPNCTTATTTTTTEEPTRETDASCFCSTDTQQFSKSSSNKVVSFETAQAEESVACICDEDNNTKNDTTADSYSQEVNSSFSCSATCSLETGTTTQTDTSSRKAGCVCSACCNCSTNGSPEATCSCIVCRGQVADAFEDTGEDDCPCQVSLETPIKSTCGQGEIESILECKPARLARSSCRICSGFKEAARLRDKQVEALIPMVSKSTKISTSTCRMCIENRSKSACTPAEAAPTTCRSYKFATRCRVCSEKRDQGDAAPEKKAKLFDLNLKSCWVNPLRSFSEKRTDVGAKKGTPSQCYVPTGVSCTSSTCPVAMKSATTSAVRAVSKKSCQMCAPDVKDIGTKGEPSDESFRKLVDRGTRASPCKQYTCPDPGKVANEDKGGGRKGPCRDDTCPVILALKESQEFGTKRCGERKSCLSTGTCISAKRAMHKSDVRDMDNQCSFIGLPLADILDTDAGKRSGGKKSCCSIETCPSAKQSKSNIRDRNNQCAFIGSPLISSSSMMAERKVREKVVAASDLSFCEKSEV
ncbi:hypothetical protein JTB14_032750 [Gonioctena quinquepunctata]|nr:hypothetical protein JTB14_032750 [Gonioctena quinquepunctata]